MLAYVNFLEHGKFYIYIVEAAKWSNFPIILSLYVEPFKLSDTEL